MHKYSKIPGFMHLKIQKYRYGRHAVERKNRQIFLIPVKKYKKFKANIKPNNLTKVYICDKIYTI